MECVSAVFNSYQKFQVVDGLQTWSRKDGLLCFFDGKKGQLTNNSIHKIDSFTLLILVIIEF